MSRRIFIALTVLVSLSVYKDSFGRGAGGGSVDPYLLPPIAPQGGVVNPISQKTSGLTPRALQTVDASVRNLIIIGAGQSNMADSPQASAFSPVNPTKLDQLNIMDGGIYPATDPLLGCSVNSGGGNPILRLGDALITANLFDRVILASIAIDGTAVSEWETGTYSTRFAVLFKRLAAKGLVAGTNVTVIVLWGQGETDTTNGTGTSAYQTSLNNVIAASRAAGFAGTWFVATQTYNTGTTSSAIQTAQANVVNHGAGIWAGPNADAIIGTTCGGLTCRPDNLHFGDNGMPVYVGSVSGWQAALHLFGAPF